MIYKAWHTGRDARRWCGCCTYHWCGCAAPPIAPWQVSQRRAHSEMHVEVPVSAMHFRGPDKAGGKCAAPRLPLLVHIGPSLQFQ